MTASTPRAYDLIGFGDEVPGVLALVTAAREHRRRLGKPLRTLLMFKGDSRQGVGGHLVRGGLAYLDRSNVPPDIRRSLNLPTFGEPAAIYTEFLQRAGVTQIALDRQKADKALRQMLSEAGVDMISSVAIAGVQKTGSRLTGIQTARGETYTARQFIDSTVNAELAQAAGVPKLKGFETFGLPESELPVTLVFETEGLSIQRLRDVELAYLRRFANRNDTEAQRFISLAAGGDPALIEHFRQTIVDAQGNLRTMHVGSDHIDVRSRALSIAYHAFRGTKLFLNESGAILDCGNIAVLPNGRLSWNALLCQVTGSQAEALARASAKPTAAMLQEMGFIDRFFKSLGAKIARPMIELYIRHAGNVTGTVEPLSGADMLLGGVASSEALGTFGYHLDVRGGIPGLGAKAAALGISSVSFHHPPLFNIGIRHAQISLVPNLAVVSPASGFDGYACSAGRIVEFNCGVGQGLGIAASLAIASNRLLADVSNREVRQILAQTGRLPRIYGTSYALEAARLEEFERIVVA